MRHPWDILWKASIISIIISTLLFSAGAESVKLCDSIPAKLMDWNSSVTLPKFDPDMGTLKNVDLLCIMNLSQGIELENKNPDPGNFTLSIQGGLNVMLPSSQPISINFNRSTQGNVSGYDGISDFSGPSGINSNEYIPTEPASMSISNVGDFLAGYPGENITLPVMANINSNFKVPGSSSSGLTLKAGAQVCITYTYEEKSNEKDGRT